MSRLIEAVHDAVGAPPRRSVPGQLAPQGLADPRRFLEEWTNHELDEVVSILNPVHDLGKTLS